MTGVRRRLVHVDLGAGVFTIRKTYAKGKLKTYAKTVRPAGAPDPREGDSEPGHIAPREGILFSAAGGNRIDINNWRSRQWTPALKAACVEHRRIYDMRHTFATWSLAAGMSIVTLARRMGTKRPCHRRDLPGDRRGRQRFATCSTPTTQFVGA